MSDGNDSYYCRRDRGKIIRVQKPEEGKEYPFKWTFIHGYPIESPNHTLPIKEVFEHLSPKDLYFDRRSFCGVYGSDCAYYTLGRHKKGEGLVDYDNVFLFLTHDPRENVFLGNQQEHIIEEKYPETILREGLNYLEAYIFSHLDEDNPVYSIKEEDIPFDEITYPRWIYFRDQETLMSGQFTGNLEGRIFSNSGLSQRFDYLKDWPVEAFNLTKLFQDGHLKKGYYGGVIAVDTRDLLRGKRFMRRRYNSEIVSLFESVYGKNVFGKSGFGAQLDEGIEIGRIKPKKVHLDTLRIYVLNPDYIKSLLCCQSTHNCNKLSVAKACFMSLNDGLDVSLDSEKIRYHTPTVLGGDRPAIIVSTNL